MMLTHAATLVHLSPPCSWIKRRRSLIQGYYTSYMAKFDEKIGIQITTLAWNPVSTEAYFNQIAACTSQEKILPEVDPKVASTEHEAAATSSKAVCSSSRRSRSTPRGSSPCTTSTPR